MKTLAWTGLWLAATVTSLAAQSYVWVANGAGNSVTIKTPGGATVTTLFEHGPAAAKVDLLVIGEGYTAAQMPKFRQDATRLVGRLFAGGVSHSARPSAFCASGVTQNAVARPLSSARSTRLLAAYHRAR